MILWASHCFNISASFTCFCERLLCLCLISVQMCRWSNSPCLQTYPAVLNLSPLKRVIKFRVVQSAFTTKFDDFFPVYVQIYVFFSNLYSMSPSLDCDAPVGDKYYSHLSVRLLQHWCRPPLLKLVSEWNLFRWNIFLIHFSVFFFITHLIDKLQCDCPSVGWQEIRSRDLKMARRNQ